MARESGIENRYLTTISYISRSRFKTAAYMGDVRIPYSEYHGQDMAAFDDS